MEDDQPRRGKTHEENMRDLALFLDGEPERNEEECDMFSVDQKVVIKVYYNTPSFWNQEGNMNKYMGKTVTIMRINAQEETVRIHEDGGQWTWRFEDLDPVEDTNNPNFLFRKRKRKVR